MSPAITKVKAGYNISSGNVMAFDNTPDDDSSIK
jgi:hypothetical protein